METTAKMITRADRNGYKIRRCRGFYYLVSNFDKHTDFQYFKTKEEAEVHKAEMEELERRIIEKRKLTARH